MRLRYSGNNILEQMLQTVPCAISSYKKLLYKFS